MTCLRIKIKYAMKIQVLNQRYFFVVYLAACLSADANSIMDQHQEENRGHAVFWANSYLAQTFTVGISGTLDRIEVGLVGYSPFTTRIELVETSNGAPTGNLLAYTTKSFVNGWNSFNFSTAAIHLNAGSKYAFILRNNDPDNDNQINVDNQRDESGAIAAWIYDGYGYWNDYYTGGEYWRNSGSGWVNMNTVYPPNYGGDLQFRTYMTQDLATTNVPDVGPGLAGLLTLGSIFFGSRRRVCNIC